MKRLLLIGVLMFAFAMTVSMPAFAGDHDGDGSDVAKNETCPLGFDHAHQVLPDGKHDDGSHGDHKHVGNDENQNGNDWICVKHTGKGDKIHVHADNNYRRGQQPQ